LVALWKRFQQCGSLFSDKVTHRAVLGQIKSTLNDHKQHVCCMRVKLNIFLEVLDGKPNILSFTADSI
jgi:hypothetical protein